VRRPRTSALAVAALLALLATEVVAPASAALRSPTATRARPQWAKDLDAIIGDRPFSVVVGRDGEVWYRHLGWVARPPASNQKLLLSMTLLARFGAGRIFRTEVRRDGEVVDGVLHGDLWLVGHGDPETGRDDLRRLAEAVRAAGIDRVRGRVIGGLGPFARDWWAPGWKDYFPRDYIALPTALTFERNTDRRGVHIRDPERRAAVAFTRILEGLGTPVRRDPRAIALPGGLSPVVSEPSRPLSTLLRHMNPHSRNFWAEVLGKALAYDRTGAGSIAGAAAAICAWVAARSVRATCRDASGLSYDDRVTARGIVRLLWFAEGRPWVDALRASLPTAGEGTLEDRLAGIRIRAKTGTLIDASALSGWVWTEEAGRVEFSILSSGFDDEVAKRIEDRIVRTIVAEATAPA
jgi:D-alanyl-D-alanine carboxypeptidase/D-alanyl-D-alanine-endopeptidase (penicillin-binding protein 4)